jgi:hypothetical protein
MMARKLTLTISLIDPDHPDAIPHTREGMRYLETFRPLMEAVARTMMRDGGRSVEYSSTLGYVDQWGNPRLEDDHGETEQADAAEDEQSEPV